MEQDGQKTRWVLLDMQGGDNDQQFMNQTSNKFMPARIEVVPDKPEYDRGYRNYAIVKSHNKQGGNVYEIGWFAWSGGTGRWEYLRVFYLWQDAKKKWRIIGEGPEESMGRYSGWEFGGKSVESEIEWKDQPIHPIIKFVQIESHSEACEQPSGLPGIHSRRDAILEISDGAKPGKLRWLSDRPYIMAQKGDTLEKIAQDRAAWSMAHYSAKNPAEEMQRQEKIRNAWFKALVFLNPEISKKDVSAGDRINLPTSTEIAASLQAKTQPAGQ
ncbi:MAG: hypothetical protein HZA50_07125 [Planctomycetes bacterium]|nr:hypothetical protein [Planctomycetota bacterium]